jgi:hypothetical protein
MKLNKTQQYAIEHLHGAGKTPEEISNELDIALKSVVSVINKIPKPEPAPSQEVKKMGPSDFMINKTQTGKDRGVMIMTQQASMMSENAAKSSPGENPAIYRPKSK